MEELRNWFLGEGWMMPFAAAVWFGAEHSARAFFAAVRRRQSDSPNAARILTIEAGAAEFLVKWLLLLSLVVTEAYLALQFLREFFPQFYTRHSGFLREAIRRAKVIGLILVCMVTLRKLARVMTEAVLARFVGGGISQAREREQRARTLIGFLNGAVTVTLSVLATVLVLGELGIPVAPLLTGAGVAGVAVAFGAQALLRDFFAGFFIALENQYNIGDMVEIGGRQGLVEQVTLRVTALRDEYGTLHIIPNGEIKSVSNMSYLWAQAVVDITAPYTHDAGTVIDALEAVAREFVSAPGFEEQVTGEYRVQGMQNLSPQGAAYRVVIKTRPLKQWQVAREFRRRAFAALEQRGIPALPPGPIPQPQQPQSERN